MEGPLKIDNGHVLKEDSTAYIFTETQNFYFLFKFMKKSDVCIAEDMTHFDTWVNLVNSVPHTILSFLKD